MKLSLNLPGGLFQLHLSPEGVFSVPYVSESFIKQMAHQTSAAIINPNNYLKYIHPEDIQHYIQAVKDFSDRLCHLNHRFRYQREVGTYRWLHITATPERQEDGGTIWHRHVSDATIQCENERQLQRLAYNDALTGLPRRAILDNSLPAIIESCDRKEEWAAVLLFDLDGFKLLNDRHGHDVGDAILVEAANRLECNTLDTDFVYRYGGNEFVVVVANDPGTNLSQATEHAQALAEKIRSSFEECYKIRGLRLSATSSIGIALIEPGKSVAEEILATADDAMYGAKRRGGNTVFIANKGRSCEAPPTPLKEPQAMSA